MTSETVTPKPAPAPAAQSTGQEAHRTTFKWPHGNWDPKSAAHARRRTRPKRAPATWNPRKGANQ